MYLIKNKAGEVVMTEAQMEQMGWCPAVALLWRCSHQQKHKVVWVGSRVVGKKDLLDPTGMHIVMCCKTCGDYLVTSGT